MFLDACTIIYSVEMAEPHYSELARFFAQYHSQHPQAKITVSRLSYLECLVKPLRENNTVLIGKYQNFFQRNGLEIIDLTASVIETATELRAHYGLTTPDAIQAASCLHSSAFLFVTNDLIFKRVPQLKVYIP
ncbi:MAG: PIN domain-containing protein [Proteobacteria bacterium]|nr:PIN domain-containing protein [Pseudomonadota bacterium]